MQLTKDDKMRELRFKAQRPVTREWVEFQSMIRMTDVDSGELQISVIPSGFNYKNDGSDFDGAVDVDPETVCQYTGLNDANGERIFEGDIVVIKYGAAQWEYVVIYDTCGFKLKSSSGNIFSNYFYQHSGFLKVIGNIHDKKDIES